MSDKITSFPKAQSTMQIPANLPAETLERMLRERRDSKFHHAVMDNMPVQVNGEVRLDLIETIPFSRRNGIARKSPLTGYEVYVGFGLTEEEAAARAKELETSRAATGDHLWN